jgi:hypothetical protein
MLVIAMSVPIPATAIEIANDEPAWRNEDTIVPLVQAAMAIRPTMITRSATLSGPSWRNHH